MIKAEYKYKIIITMILTLSMLLILSITLNNVQTKAVLIHNKTKIADSYEGIHPQRSAR